MLAVDRFLTQEGLALFNTPAFFQLHAIGRAHYFQWLQGGRAVACIHFTEVKPGLFRSPARGTYAGLSSLPEVRTEELAAFLAAVQEHLRALGAQRLEVLLPPARHDVAQFSNQYYLMRALGFVETGLDLNFGMAVTAQPFIERIAPNNQRRLRKCRREGLLATQLDDGELGAVHALLEEHHRHKGYPMSMSRAQLQTMLELFPGQLRLFGCQHGERLVAAAICVQIRKDIRYIFCIGDLAEYASYSPSVALVDAIYGSCQEEGIALFDYGVSTLGLEANYGLIHFKRGLGFGESLKPRLEKVLDA
ncbi:GNAT family N-acetyltransferase [Metapseudomonas furukawaii]|uniref:GNAT family N-acetyltransferase n=1 Tax=Metapseudomonas furukawaii TaxID=1149133 RepID=UPI00227C72A9|nr:GNAT family N-acetyltransferase [Pseudomonas furukawaii]WAG77622.1 GNAT family N-acetyltransferase [Pseudomonas furukawaii]